MSTTIKLNTDYYRQLLSDIESLSLAKKTPDSNIEAICKKSFALSKASKENPALIRPLKGRIIELN